MTQTKCPTCNAPCESVVCVHETDAWCSICQNEYTIYTYTPDPKAQAVLEAAREVRSEHGFFMVAHQQSGADFYNPSQAWFDAQEKLFDAVAEWEKVG